MTIQTAVIVAGHAVLRGCGDPMLDESWVLLDFQVGEGPCYVEHVERGVREAAARPDALLIFSGGQSRLAAGPRSEAQSYFAIAERYGWFGCSGVAERATTEEFARDSYENLLFGACRFREYTGRYPEAIVFVSWRFKRERFELHREAIRWPSERYCYIGANDPPRLEQALAAERKTAEGYRRDPYSAMAEYAAKRDSRNPFRRQHGYFTSCPEAAKLFVHRGPALFEGALPWYDGGAPTPGTGQTTNRLTPGFSD